jgi:hypothetical protein
MICNGCGKELGQFSSKEVARMVFSSQRAQNCKKLLANRWELRLDAVKFGRAMKETRGGFVKTNRIINKILRSGKPWPGDFGADCQHSCSQSKQGGR